VAFNASALNRVANHQERASRIAAAAGLFCRRDRSQQPMAAREQREHQWAAPPVLAEGVRPLPSHPERAPRHRPLARSIRASTDTRVDDTISGVRRGRCVDPLRTHRAGDAGNFARRALPARLHAMHLSAGRVREARAFETSVRHWRLYQVAYRTKDVRRQPT
jgi:hypothetical protein